MRARLKAFAIIHGPDSDWVKHREVYEAEFSEKMISPKPVVLIHPMKPIAFCELPFNGVEILSD